jgi:hypothetical protein
MIEHRVIIATATDSIKSKTLWLFPYLHFGCGIRLRSGHVIRARNRIRVLTNSV